MRLHCAHLDRGELLSLICETGVTTVPRDEGNQHDKVLAQSLGLTCLVTWLLLSLWLFLAHFPLCAESWGRYIVAAVPLGSPALRLFRGPSA